MNEHRLSEGFLRQHPEQAARVLERLPATMVIEFLRSLEAEAAATALTSVVSSFAHSCLDVMAPEEAARILPLVPLEQAANLLRTMPPAGRDKYLKALADSQRSVLLRLLRYAPDSIGAIMQTGVFALPGELSVAEAIKRIRATGRQPLQNIYVTRQGQRLAGRVSWDSLLRAPEQTPLERIISGTLVPLPARMSLQKARQLEAWRDHRRLPVVANRGVLVGEVAFADIDSALSQPRQQDDGPDAAATPMELLWQMLASLVSVIAGLIYPPHPGTRRRE